jgi:hypothetical protein
MDRWTGGNWYAPLTFRPQNEGKAHNYLCRPTRKISIKLTHFQNLLKRAREKLIASVLANT